MRMLLQWPKTLNFFQMSFENNLHKLCDVQTSFLIHLRSFELVMRNDKELYEYDLFRF